ncbi:MAG: hypothetical protein NUK62_05895 [Tenericutes bacterium]|nr:hypothetical protein [Mycoplasmatota bacterium]
MNLMKILNHKGFSMLEALASVFIISLVLTTTITIIANVRNQVLASDRQIAAIEVGSQIRDQIYMDYDYDTLSLWIGDSEIIVDYENCNDIDNPISCSLFQYTLNNLTYDENVLIIFEAPTEQSIQFQVIHFRVEIVYHDSRKIQLEGIIYG